MSGPLDTAFEVAELLDELGIRYALGGSLASSIFGEPRATFDIDLAVEVALSQLEPALAAFEGRGFYVPRDSTHRAQRTHSSFNVIHPGGFKVDLFVTGDRLLDRLQMERRVLLEVVPGEGRRLWVTAPADQILRKLDLFRAGGEVSDRQWRDVLGLISAHRDRLDLDGLRQAAAVEGLSDLLERALASAEAG